MSGSASARITLRGHPGEDKPRILGLFALEGDYLTASRLLFDGPSGAPRSEYAIPVWITGDHNELGDSEVRDARSQGIYLDGAEDVRLVGNYIHDNGDKDEAASANLHHGIYFARGSGLIADNLIANNYAFGVHLYPSAHDVLVERNTILGNGRAGVVIAGERGAPVPKGNRVVNNTISGNGQKPVTSFGPLGRGNVVGHNLSRGNGAGGSTDGLEMTEN